MFFCHLNYMVTKVLKKKKLEFQSRAVLIYQKTLVLHPEEVKECRIWPSMGGVWNVPFETISFIAEL